MSRVSKALSKVKAILFDLDNTLMDFMKMKEHAIENAVEAMIDSGLPLSKNEAIKTISELYEKFGIEYQNIFDELLKQVTGKVDYKILAAGVVAYRRVKEGYVEPYPHVIPTLKELMTRGFVLGIISDAPAFQVWTRLVGMNLHHFFDIVISLEETGVRKPKELPFKAAIKKLGLEPEEIMMVGDDPRRDIVGANLQGFTTVLAKYGSFVEPDPTKPEQKADYEIEDIKQLLNILPENADQ